MTETPVALDHSEAARSFASLRSSREFFLWLSVAICLILVSLVRIVTTHDVPQPETGHVLWLAKSLEMAGLGSGILVLACVFWALTGYWPLRALANALDTKSGISEHPGVFRGSARSISGAPLGQAGALERLNEELITDALMNAKVTSGEFANRSLAYLLAMTERSESVAWSSRRLKNLYLGGGVATGVIGMLYFLVTTQSDIFAKVTFDQVKTVPNSWPLLVANFGHLLPRITVLIFIEVLAGFFLKQYHTAFDEFRYYETIARRREAAVVSFLIHKEFPEDEVLRDLASELLKVPTSVVLKAGETTEILESYRSAQNEFLGIFSELAAVLKEAGGVLEKATKTN